MASPPAAPPPPQQHPPGRCSAAAARNLNNNNNNGGGGHPQSTPTQEPPEPPLPPPPEPPLLPPGVRKCGYLRKHKHGHKRFFVLRGPGGGVAGGSGAPPGGEGDPRGGSSSPTPPARLDYYESEKKWRGGGGGKWGGGAPPKRSLALDGCLQVHKRADAKHKHLVALYARDETVALAAEGEAEQEAWYQAIAQVLRESRGGADERAKPAPGSSPPPPLEEGLEHGGASWPLLGTYREVWQVTLKAKGLLLGQGQGQQQQSRPLTAGVHRLCLAPRTVGLVRLHGQRPCVTLPLMTVRRCGHSDSFFFLELGRSAATGPGELWMQADDAVVAQHIHETVLEAMKALRETTAGGELFRPRSKSQSSSSSSSSSSGAASGGGGGGLSFMCSRPISVPGPRRHPRHPCTALPPSQTGLLRRSRTDLLNSHSADTAGTQAQAAASEGDGGSRVGYLSGSSPDDAGRTPPGGGRPHLLPGHSLGQSPWVASRLAEEPKGATSSSPQVVPPPPPSSTSPWGSPHDTAAFLAFEELGSSPGGNPQAFSSSLTLSNHINTTGMSPGQHLEGSYIAMDRGRRWYRPSRWENAGGDTGPRKRTYSLTTPVQQHLLPLPHSSTSLDEYTLMRATLPASCSSPQVTSLPYPEDYCDVDFGSTGTSSSSSSHLGYSAGKEEGYMSMAPRILSVLPLQGDPDGYMSMSPTSVSPPQLILHPVPSRIGSESSDDSSYMHMWGTSARFSGENLDGRSTSAGDYINMSPVLLPSSASNGFAAFQPSPSRISWSEATFLGETKDSDQYVFMNSLAGNHTPKEVHSTITVSLPIRHSQTENSLNQPPSSIQPRSISLGLLSPSINGPPPSNEPPASNEKYIHIGYSMVPVCDRPASFIDPGMEECHSSLLSDYMNLNFEGSQSGAPSVGSLEEGLLPESCPHSDNHESKGGVQITCFSSSFSEAGDYAEMLYTTAAAPPQPRSCQPESTPAGSPVARLKRLTLSGIETSLFSSPPPDPNHGPKVIRADPQGRRRHSSETFSSTTTVTPVSPSFAHNPKRHNSASVENVSLRKSEGFVEEQNYSPMCRETSAGFQNGLNYIAVDVFDRDHLSKGIHGNGGPLNGSIGAYTTVDFLAYNLKEASPVRVC